MSIVPSNSVLRMIFYKESVKIFFTISCKEMNNNVWKEDDSILDVSFHSNAKINEINIIGQK